MCMCTCMCMCMYMCRYVYIFASLFVCLSACMSVGMCVRLYLSFYLYVSISLFLCFCLLTHIPMLRRISSKNPCRFIACAAWPGPEPWKNRLWSALGHPTTGPACSESLEMAFARHGVNWWAPGDSFHGINQVEWVCSQESDAWFSETQHCGNVATFMGASENFPLNLVVWQYSLFQTKPNRVVGGFNLQKLEMFDIKWLLVGCPTPNNKPGAMAEVGQGGQAKSAGKHLPFLGFPEGDAWSCAHRWAEANWSSTSRSDSPR